MRLHTQKAGGTVNVYMCVHKGDVGRIEKFVISSTHTKLMATNKCDGIFFVCWSGHKRKKRKDSLEGGLDRVLFATELKFSKILVPKQPQIHLM